MGTSPEQAYRRRCGGGILSVQAIPRDLAQAVRSGNLFSSRGSSVLDAPEPDRAQKNSGAQGLKRRTSVTEMPLRREKSYVETFSSDYSEDMDQEFRERVRRPGVRLSLKGGLVPKTIWGRIAAGGALLVIAGAVAGGTMWARSLLLSDEHFTVPTSASIQIAGNSHLTRAQLLSVFGEDVDRNIFRIPLERRKAELESLPWVAHATVMRLLPNRVRVSIVERTPVAFVRQGTQIGLVDATGALFDMPDAGSGGKSAAHYSFPVLTGISAGDPLSTRAARMRIYMSFVAALDATGENISRHLSEVDLSNPEDVRAILPDGGPGGNDILVHFGEEKFLERYHSYLQHLPEWRTQYPKLASVDMRYEQQVILEMQPGTTAPSAEGTVAPETKTAKAAAPVAAAPVHAAVAAKKPVVAKKAAAAWKPKWKPAGAAHSRAAIKTKGAGTRVPVQGASR